MSFSNSHMKHHSLLEQFFE
uniref:Uncharacterized protein n=1 Tax=Arundo donax TaxID=35708 RepID=A0A0A9E4Q2_ARUDO